VTTSENSLSSIRSQIVNRTGRLAAIARVTTPVPAAISRTLVGERLASRFASSAA
jgi:hypothetical protein